MFKEMRSEVKFGIGVLLLLALFAGAWIYSSGTLDAVVDEAILLNEAWLPGVVLLRDSEFFSYEALCALRALRGGEEKIDAAQKILEKLLVSLEAMKRHASIHDDLAAHLRRLDEAAGMAHTILGSLQEVRVFTREKAKLRSEIEGALEALRERSRKGLADERGVLERLLLSGESGRSPEAVLAAIAGRATLDDAVESLARKLVPFFSEEGEERAEAVREDLSLLRVALRDVRMETFDDERLQRIDSMTEAMDIFQGALDDFVRAAVGGSDRERRAAASGESLVDLVGGIRETMLQDALGLSGSLTHRSYEASRTRVLALQIVSVCAILIALGLVRKK